MARAYQHRGPETDDPQTDLFDPATLRETVGIAFKRLVRVDLPRQGSNQHELNGIKPLKALLGERRIQNGPVRWIVTGSGTDFGPVVEGTFTWYDAREAHPTRSEHRLYYGCPNGLDSAEIGDSLFFIPARFDHELRLLILVARGDSPVEHQLLAAFHIAGDSRRLVVKDRAAFSGALPAPGVAEFLSMSGVRRGPGEVAPVDLDRLRRRFAGGFPSTAVFSAYARESAGLPSTDDPDGLLLTWMEREELLYRALEEVLVRDKLEDGFADVDDFVAVSLSLLNRRKSRAGRALEHHLRTIFDSHGIEYSYNVLTEGTSRPDFVFPSIECYRDQEFPAERLHMLAAKTSVKERWSQILSEAIRIRVKHLCTLEKGLPEGLTREMKAKGVVLVLPEPLHTHFSGKQREDLLSLRGFLKLVS